MDIFQFRFIKKVTAVCEGAVSCTHRIDNPLSSLNPIYSLRAVAVRDQTGSRVVLVLRNLSNVSYTCVYLNNRDIMLSFTEKYAIYLIKSYNFV